MEKRRKKSLRQARKIGTEEKRSKFVLLFAGYVATKEQILYSFISCSKDIYKASFIVRLWRKLIQIIQNKTKTYLVKLVGRRPLK